MNEDLELRRRMIALRLEWLQQSGVALPADLAEVARAWADEQKECEAAIDVPPSLGECVSSSDDPVEVAELLTADSRARPDAWFVFSIGDCVTGWLEKHPHQAIGLFQAFLQRGERGEGLASRVVAWLSDHADHSQLLSCLSMLAGASKTVRGQYLISSVARAVMVLAENRVELKGKHEFWPIWSFAVSAAIESSQPAQPHESSPLTDSLNAPGGYLAQALIFKFHWEEEEGEIRQEYLKERLHMLSTGGRDFNFLARTMLASRLPWLHGIDREWAKDVLIARMAWSGAEPTSEARGLWQGYLWAPQLNPKLLEDLKPAFLQALTCDLGLRRDDNLFRLFADLLLKAPDKLTNREKHNVFRDMLVDGLIACAHYWRQVLQGAPEGAADTWREKIGPLIKLYWPAIKEKVTPETVEALARLAIRTNEAFPEAFGELLEKSLLTPVAKSGVLLRELVKPGADTAYHYDYIAEHPFQTLALIDRSIDFEKLTFEKDTFGEILKRARGADASVERTETYRRLYQRSLA